MKTKELNAKSQNKDVLNYMIEHGSITSMDAFMDLGITRLSGRIYDLKRLGYGIKSTMEKALNKRGKEVKYARYTLVKED